MQQNPVLVRSFEPSSVYIIYELNIVREILMFGVFGKRGLKKENSESTKFRCVLEVKI